MLRNSEKSNKRPYYLRNKNLSIWLPESLHNWFTEYLTNTAMEAALNRTCSEHWTNTHSRNLNATGRLRAKVSNLSKNTKIHRRREKPKLSLK